MTTIAEAFVTLRPDLTGFGEEARREAERALNDVGSRLTSAGSILTSTVTAPLVATAAAAGKLAIDFESSFAGIRKTMDLSEEDFQRLSDMNRALATEIPVSVNELNRIGELAGQLGIRGVDNVLLFEDTIAKLAVTTNLTAEQAALAFAQISNVMQLPQDQIDNLGAAVVGLGNNFETTESSIVDFMQRIAGAGAIAGLTAGDVAGISTAFASLGIEAEAGGTAVQKVLISMVSAATKGGDELQAFARTAGVSAEEFQQMFAEDAAGAFVAFVDGLRREGDRAIFTLEELGLTDQRLMRAFLAAAGAGDLLRDAVRRGNEDFRENNALQDEAAKRFETLASQIQVRLNQLQDAFIELGLALFPVFDAALRAAGPAIDAVRVLAEAFAALPMPVQAAFVALAALVAITPPLILGLGLMVQSYVTLTGAIAAARTAQIGLNIAMLANPITAALAVGVVAVGVAYTQLKNDAKAATEALVENRYAGFENMRVLEETRDKLIDQRAALEDVIQAEGRWTDAKSKASAELGFTEMKLADVEERIQQVAAEQRQAADVAEFHRAVLNRTRVEIEDLGRSTALTAEDIANLTPRMVAAAAAARIVAIQMNEAIPAPLRLAASMHVLADGMDAMRAAAEVQATYEGLIGAMFALTGITDGTGPKAAPGGGATGAAARFTAVLHEQGRSAEELAVTIAELGARSAATQYAQELLAAGATSVEAAMRMADSEVVSAIRDLAEMEGMAVKVAEALLGVEGSADRAASGVGRMNSALNAFRSEGERINKMNVDIFRDLTRQGIDPTFALDFAQQEQARARRQREDEITAAVSAGTIDAATANDLFRALREGRGDPIRESLGLPSVTQQITVNVTDGSPAAIANATTMGGLELAHQLKAEGF